MKSCHFHVSAQRAKYHEGAPGLLHQKRPASPYGFCGRGLAHLITTLLRPRRTLTHRRKPHDHGCRFEGYKVWRKPSYPKGSAQSGVSPEHKCLKMLYAEPFHAPPILISFAIPSFDALHECEVGPQKHPNTKPSHPSSSKLARGFSLQLTWEWAASGWLA